MKKLESMKRILVLFLSAIGLLAMVGGYAVVWYRYYTVEVAQFWFKGNLLLIIIYGMILFATVKTYGGTKIGYLKPFEIFLSQVIGILFTNAITYAQLSLMHGWFATPKTIIFLTIAQILFAFGWIFLSDFLYKTVFPPRDLLLVHADRPIDDIVAKFETRKDRFNIAGKIHVNKGLDAVKDEIIERYDGVILWDIDTVQRNILLKFCYANNIRVYLMPKIPDVIITGADKMHLFDTPILLTREYPLTFEERFIKRAIDIFCSLVLIIVTSPIMLFAAIVIKLSDGGPVFFKQVRCTTGGKEFKIVKFRSMRVDAEKDGVARLASKGDPRITPFGKFIRKVRIDELPQLFNILKGEMSFIGPRPERPEIIAQYMEEMPEFAYRTKVKAGLAGYAQVYGKYNTTPYDKLKLDLYYIESYSTWLDIKLMLLTIKVLFLPDATEGVDANQTTAQKTKEN